MNVANYCAQGQLELMDEVFSRSHCSTIGKLKAVCWRELLLFLFFVYSLEE